MTDDQSYVLINAVVSVGGIAITVVVAVTGWIIIVFNGTRLARRGEVNAVVNDIVSTARSLRKDVLDSWTSLGDEDILGEDKDYMLSSQCSDIEHNINHLRRYYFDPKVSALDIAKIRRLSAAPGALLEVAGNGYRLTELQSLTSELVLKVRDESQKYFQRKG